VCGENLCEDVVCNDEDACTQGTCDYVDGTCAFTPVVCDDGNECTEDRCDPVDECIFTAVEDGTACWWETWVCVAGECVRPECQTCDDGNECTEDRCDPVVGCIFTPVEDGTACGSRVCVAGECVECESAEDCDDRNDCTEDICSGGVCEYPEAKDGAPCAGGACLAGACELTGSVLPCTEQGIRNAVAAGGGPYTFDCDGPQTVMTGAAIHINNSVILDGEGNLTVDANEAHRVFVVSKDVSAELRGVTVTGGARPLQYGGGIYNYGVLTLTNSTVSENSANSGGGVYNGPGSALTLTNSTVSGNSAEYSGGGIYNRTEATLTNSTVSGNTSGGDGGGIAGGTITLTNSTVSGNNTERDGGGISSYSGALTLTNSTVSGNTSGGHSENNGGGIYSGSGGALTLTNSTVSGNSAKLGGGIYSGSEATLTNSTVSGNSAERAGGGIVNFETLTLTNTVVDGECLLYGAPTASNGYNIESPGDTCGLDQPTDRFDVTEGELNLGPLADNGGATMTHALLPGSVAIDVIPEAACEVTEDQRGVTRPQGAMCDVGAFEVQPSD